MNYISAILEKFIHDYERRGLFQGFGGKNRQGIFLYPEKIFPEYSDFYNEDAYLEINEALEFLRQQGIVHGNKDSRGQYQRLRFDPAMIDRCYKLTGRVPLEKTRRSMKALLCAWNTERCELLEQFRAAQLQRLQQNKSLEHGIGDDLQKLQDVTLALSALMQLRSETYIRNFSKAVFADSKHFQKIRGCIEAILCAYGGQELTRKTVLSTFNLVNNPTYVMFKGYMHIHFHGQTLHVEDIPGGIALPSTALPAIEQVSVEGTSLVTVENLTTYHDEQVKQNAIVYLGGFHNAIRTDLLKHIYTKNPKISFFHKGDIDVYGFLILENLKSKTRIPFQPLEMDLETLKQYEAHRLVQPLSTADRKLLHLPHLAPYQEVLTYMEQHNCKAEQESQQALLLMLDS